MQNNTPISARQISLFSKTASTSSPAASPASRSARQASDEARRTTAISGRRCCERFGRSVPCWVVGENVLGIVSWSQGLVFEQVCADLEAEGYSVQPYVLPACGVDAPHRRYRTWFVAHLADGSDARSEDMSKRTDGAAAVEFTADADSQRCDYRFCDKQQGSVCRDVDRYMAQNRRSGCELELGLEQDVSVASAPGTRSERICSTARRHGGIPDWDDFPTQPPVRRGDDGLSERLDPAAVFAGLDRKHKRRSHVARWCAEAIKCYGNAIVPQVAYRILTTIYRYESRIAE